MNLKQSIPVRFAVDGATIKDEAGEEHFVLGYGAGKNDLPEFDTRIDLNKPIWDQVKRLTRRDEREEKSPLEAA